MTAKRLRFLITAGPTREYLDPVRYLSNDSSGKMGFALAAAAARRGHQVVLVHGPVQLKPPRGVKAVAVVSAADLLNACLRSWPKCDALIMAAAVADYAPTQIAQSKIKKNTRARVLRLKPTPDVLATLAGRKQDHQVVVGFALEDRRRRHNAEEKLRRKRLDAIVLNRPAAIGAERSALEILVRGRPWQAFPPMAKTRAAVRLVELAERLYRA